MNLELKQGRYFCNATVEDIRDYCRARLNVIICSPIGLDACEYMSRRFGIPYISLPYPIGAEKTEFFIKSIAEALQNKNDISPCWKKKNCY